MTGTVAIIPARGNSKGIPRKNLAIVAGKPLIQWSIEQSLAAGLPTFVSSDSPEILELAAACGASTIERPEHLATDDATTDDVVRHALSMVGEVYQYVVLLQPTSPIRQPTDIPAAIAITKGTGADSLFSARRVEGFLWFERQRGWEPCYDPIHRCRRQDRKEQRLEENGSIYVFKPWVLDVGGRLAGKISIMEMHPLDGFQVDEPSDLELFEQLFALRLPQEVAA